MLKERTALALDISQKLNALEDAIDQALSLGSELTQACAAGRKKANLSAVVGQDAIAMTGETIGLLFEARQRIVDSHHAFSDAGKQIGLRTFAGGDGWKPPVSAAANEEETETMNDKKAAA